MTFPYKDEEFIRMWVADMEFATPQVVIDAIKERLDRRILDIQEYFQIPIIRLSLIGVPRDMTGILKRIIL